MFAIAAIVLFILRALGINSEDFDLGWAGFVCLTLFLLVGNWPLGFVRRSDGS